MKGTILLFLFALLFVRLGYTQTVDFEKIDKLCDDNQYILAEKELISLLKKYPIEPLMGEDMLKKRISVLQRTGLFYGERGNNNLYVSVYKAGYECIEKATLSDEETSCNLLDLITGYEYLLFVAEDSVGYCQIIDIRKKLLAYLDSKNKKYKTYLLKGKLDQAWEYMNEGKLLDAKLQVMDVIQDVYLLNIDPNSCTEDTKWTECYARLLMARICIKKKEYGMVALYMNRLVHLLPRPKTLLYTAVMAKAATLHMEVKDADQFRLYSDFFKDAVMGAQSCMWPYFYEKQKDYQIKRYNCSQWEANSLAFQVDVSRQAKWSTRLQEKNQELNLYIANGQDKLFIEKAQVYYWDHLDYVANNYAGYELWGGYFDFCDVVSVNLHNIDPKTEQFIAEMFQQSCKIMTNMIICLSGISEANTWSEFENNRHPYYLYTEEVNQPFKENAMTSLFKYLNHLEKFNSTISPLAKKMKLLMENLKK